MTAPPADARLDSHGPIRMALAECRAVIETEEAS